MNLRPKNSNTEQHLQQVNRFKAVTLGNIILIFRLEISMGSMFIKNNFIFVDRFTRYLS